jgi:hypothetical protein
MAEKTAAIKMMRIESFDSICFRIVPRIVSQGSGKESKRGLLLH